MNTYEISFKSKEFLGRAIDDGPWSVMGSCLVVKEWPRGDMADKVEFSKIEFWCRFITSQLSC